MNSAALFALSGQSLFLIKGADVDDPNLLINDLPVGTYTSLRSFEGDRFLHVNHHLQRLKSSAATMKLGALVSEDLILNGLRTLADAYGLCDIRVRIDHLAEPFRVADGQNPAWITFAVVPFRGLPRTLYQHGVSAATTGELLRTRPKVKDAAFVSQRAELFISAPEVYEHLLLDETGRILEGSTSNFFAVIGSRIVTAGESILEGVTRGVFLTLIGQAGLSLDLRPISSDDLGRLDEAFITSSSRGAVPVVTIDDVTIGRGVPGPITVQLSEMYDEYVLIHAVSLVAYERLAIIS